MKQKDTLPPLDYLLIPTGWKRQREKRVLEEIPRRKITNFLSLTGCNSEEDMLYLGKRLKGNEKIGFVTFPLHYWKYKIIIKKAQKENKFPRKIYTENIKTKQTPKQFIYGVLALIEEIFDNKVNYASEENKIPILTKIKRKIKKSLAC
jgi:hypothetical protein